MPHLHLSVQAGSDLVLKRMRRRHSPGGALDVVAAGPGGCGPESRSART